MSELFPTKTRRNLLTAVHRQRVTRSPAGVVMRRGDHGFKTRAEAAVREVEAAGWVQLGDDGGTYELTDAGRAAMGGPT